jgi:hypothetical protein
MKIHNISTGNSSVTLKPTEIEEITLLGFKFQKMMQNLLDTIVEVHDNGENCPICGEEYENKDAYLDMVCFNEGCAFVQAQNLIEKSRASLGTFRLACLELGSVDTFYQPLDLE